MIDKKGIFFFNLLINLVYLNGIDFAGEEHIHFTRRVESAQQLHLCFGNYANCVQCSDNGFRKSQGMCII